MSLSKRKSYVVRLLGRKQSYATEMCRIAKDKGLSCPLGRALYAANRHMNGDWRGRPEHLGLIRRDTAERWLVHYQAGGSLKALCYTQRAWLDHRIAYMAQQRARLAREKAREEKINAEITGRPMTSKEYFAWLETLPEEDRKEIGNQRWAIYSRMHDEDRAAKTAADPLNNLAARMAADLDRLT